MYSEKTLFDKIKQYLTSKINRSNERSTRAIKNIIASFGIRGVSILASLLIVPLTLGYVSTELYGIWLTLSSVVMWLTFFDFGLSLGLKNKLAEAIALKDYSKGKSLVSTTYCMLFVFLFPICLLLFLLIPHVNWCSFLNVHSSYQIEIQKTMYVLVAFFYLQMVLNTLTQVVAAFQQTALSSLFGALGQVGALIIIFVLTKVASPSLVGLCSAFLGAPLLVLLISTIFLYSGKYKIVKPSLKYFDTKYLKELFGLGVKFFVLQIQAVVLFQTTNIIIAHLATPVTVTQYNTAYKYIMIALMLFNIVLTPIWTSFTDAYTVKDFVWMRSIYKKLTKIFGLTVLVIIVMTVFSPLAYKIWLGNKLSIPFIMTASIALYTVIYSWAVMQASIINGVGHVKVAIIVSVIGMLLHIPLSFFIGHYTGALGVIYSMTIISLLYAVVYTVQNNKTINNTAEGIWLK